MAEIGRIERTLVALTLSGTIGVALVGCGSDEPARESGGGGASAAESTASAVALDACAMLTPADITSVLGTAVEGRSTGSEPDMAGCLWENPDTYESVSLEIGNPDTAINGTLPPPEPGFPDLSTPGPDGMRFIGLGSVEFAAGKRNNNLQVAMPSMGDAANDRAVELARKVIPQVPAG